MILPEEAEWEFGERGYVASDLQPSADGAESEEFDLLYHLIQLIIFPLP